MVRLLLIFACDAVLAMTTAPAKPLYILLMFILILFWGSSFVVVKLILQTGLTPIGIATYRFLTAGAVFALILTIGKAKNPNQNLKIAKKDVPTFLILALSGVTFFFIAQYTGIELAGASVSAILVTLLSPILIAVFSARMFKEHLATSQILGIGIAAAGALIVILGGTLSLENGTNFLVGSIVLLTTPVLWTVYSLLGKRVMQGYDAFLVVSYVNVLGGLFLIPFSLAEGSLTRIVSLSVTEWLAILFLSVTCSVIGYFIWFYVLKHAGAAITSSFLFAEPVITVIFAISFANEHLSILILGGGILIFLGVWQVIRK